MLATVAKKCTAPSSAATPVFKRIVVQPAASADSSGSGSGSDS
jgi:hypothetical protein